MECPLCLSLVTESEFHKEDPVAGPLTYWKCYNCGLIFLPSQYHLPPLQEKARYDWHRNSPSDSAYVRFLERLIHPLIAKLRPGSFGLDFGCGPGPTVSHILRNKGFEVADYDPFYFPNTKLLKHKFDFITCTEVIEHLRNPRRELLLLDNLLKEEGGYLGVMTQFFDEEQDFGDWWYHNDLTHLCFYRRETFDWIAEWMGWSADYPEKNVVIFYKK